MGSRDTQLELAALSLPGIDVDLWLTGFSVGEIEVVLADSPEPYDEAIPAVSSNSAGLAG